MGTWIEMSELSYAALEEAVVPPVGTWIEIVAFGRFKYDNGRAPRGHVD